MTSELFPGMDGLRLLSAVAVIVSHAFLIAEGSASNEPLYALLHRWILGDFAVFTFFIISGFLLARSLALNGDAVQFAINRTLRILPGFAFCILVTAFVIGPVITPLDLRSYFAQSTAYAYVVDALVCLCDGWARPFLYNGHVKYSFVMNGSLWSLSYEVMSYLMLLWLWTLLRGTTRIASVFGITALMTLIFPPVAKQLSGVAYTLPYFAGGVIMYAVHRRFGTTTTLAWSALGLLCLSALVAKEHLAFAVCGPYLVVHLAQRNNIGSDFARVCGDLSYGLYLFGWPAAAAMEHLFRAQNGWLLLVYALPLGTLMAAVSWWVVEKPCIGLKHRFRALPLLNPARRSPR